MPERGIPCRQRRRADRRRTHVPTRKDVSQRSRIVDFAWGFDRDDVPLLRAFGDPDDHLRLTVLIARRLGARSRSPALRNAAETCQQADVSWNKRVDALRFLFEQAPMPEDGQHLAALFDLDALYVGRVGPRRRWNDRDFLKERREFFKELCKAVDRGGWLVLRPNPRAKVTDVLKESRMTTDAGAGVPGVLTNSADEPDLPEAARTVGADYRAILRWLMHDKRILAPDSVDEVVEQGGPGALENHVLVLAYEQLRPSAREIGKRLCALRGEHRSNGSLGPYPVAPAPTARGAKARGGDAVPADALDALKACGFLRPAGSSWARLQMPSPVRAFLQGMSRVDSPDDYVAEQRWLGKRPFEGQPVEEQLEIHHHAVQGEDYERARKTAEYYGADLRQLAFRLSRRGQFFKASRVTTSSSSRGSTWRMATRGYYGYNLARVPEGDSIPRRRGKDLDVLPAGRSTRAAQSALCRPAAGIRGSLPEKAG
ncbi:MAG: hypothetical protein R3F14_28455 [Polyangiaceae bacterium]